MLLKSCASAPAQPMRSSAPFAFSVPNACSRFITMALSSFERFSIAATPFEFAVLEISFVHQEETLAGSPMVFTGFVFSSVSLVVSRVLGVRELFHDEITGFMPKI